MSLYRKVQFWLYFGKLLVPIFYRQLQVRFLFRIARRREKEIFDLIALVGVVFQDRTPWAISVSYHTFKGLGYPTDAEGKRVGRICWNAPIGITVYAEDSPLLGLGIEFRGRALCIRQMQGVQGARPLRGLEDWPELLVRICMEFVAAGHAFQEVRVYKANQDVNFESPEVHHLQSQQTYRDAVKVHQGRMRRRYDRVAQKLKFKKKKRYYYWKVPPPAQS